MEVFRQRIADAFIAKISNTNKRNEFLREARRQLMDENRAMWI